MEDYEMVMRHLGAPVIIKLGEETLSLPRLNIDEFAKLISVTGKIEDKMMPEAEGTVEIVRILGNTVRRKFAKEIAEGKMSEENCNDFLLSNLEAFLENLEEFMPKVKGTRINQKIEEMMKRRNAEEPKATKDLGESPKPKTNS